MYTAYDVTVHDDVSAAECVQQNSVTILTDIWSKAKFVSGIMCSVIMCSVIMQITCDKANCNS